MVLLWSALASGRVALLTQTLAGMPPVPPGAGWVTYVRCHDDIGWAVTEEDAARVGEDGHLHRRFLADFYAGAFPGSFARGARFQTEPNGEARTSGTTASLAGLEDALERGDAVALDLAVRRILLAPRRRRSPTAACRSSTWATSSGCATTTGSRTTRRTATTTAGCTARRWTGRPRSAAATRATVEGRLWAGPARARRGAPRQPGRPTRRAASTPVWTGNDHVFGLAREHAGDRLLLLGNFSPAPQQVHAGVARAHSVRPFRDGGPLSLGPYEFAWMRN